MKHIRCIKQHTQEFMMWYHVGSYSGCLFEDFRFINPGPAEPRYAPPPPLENSVDPDHLASEEPNQSGSALFVIKHMNLYQQPRSNNLIGRKLKVGVALNLFSMTKVKFGLCTY